MISSQPDINMKIQALLNDYLDSHFRPAFRNMKTNLGEYNVKNDEMTCFSGF